jgi:hypothetical protein
MAGDSERAAAVLVIGVVLLSARMLSGKPTSSIDVPVTVDMALGLYEEVEKRCGTLPQFGG